METEHCYWWFCFKPIESTQDTNIFGFSEFLTAIALLVVIYTITDVRYKFRLAITPGPLYITTFISIAVIGVQSLLTEIWVREGWWVPKTIGLNLTIWQGLFGLLFLSIILTWMYYAFIRPPIFNTRNTEKYAQELYRYILRGNTEELKVIANEFARSAKPLIKYSKEINKYSHENENSFPKKRKDLTKEYAHDILLLIANRNFCRQIVKTSPVTAQALFEEMTEANKFNVPIGPFAQNISAEAVAQEESFLYNEAEGFSAGLLGYLKPVSQAIYGNYLLVERLEDNHGSPLDIDFNEQWDWNAKQWKAYYAAVLITLKDYLKNGNGSQHSHALYKAFSDIKSSYQDLYKLNDTPNVFENNDIFDRFDITSKFVKDAIGLIDTNTNPPNPKLRPNENNYHEDIYDLLADLIFDMCCRVSEVNSPENTASSIHVEFWHKFFTPHYFNKNALKIVLFKVRRKLFDEILKLEKYPNYYHLGSRILGFCLNVIGLNMNDHFKKNHSYPLAKAIHSWTIKNYLKLQKENSDVANSVLIGKIKFDKNNARLVETYSKDLNNINPQSYLDLK